MRINQCPFVNKRTDVDEHWRHADDRRSEVRAKAGRRPPGNNTHTVGDGESTGREGVFVHKGEAFAAAHLYELAKSEAKQDALFHPRIHLPPAVSFFRRANFSAREGVAKLEESSPSVRVAFNIG